MSTLGKLDVPDIQERLDKLEELMEFVLNSVMIPRTITTKVVGPNIPPSRTVLIPLKVMWNALQETRAQIAREKSALLNPTGTDNG